MGKVSTTEVMKRRKKKGRPPKNSLSLYTPPSPDNYVSAATTSGKSITRNPNSVHFPPSGFSVDGGDDDDERKEKKVKLVVRIPHSDENSNMLDNQNPQGNKDNKRHSRDYDLASGSGSDSGPESEDRVPCANKRKIHGVDRGSDIAAAIQGKKVEKATDTPLYGSPLESGPTSLLPDKKLLVFILDRLQKKDTYGVFSEPVDINELPDYFEIIENPMDFGTVRNKLNSGSYKSLQELEDDVFLICSNAMQYNAQDTVYYRQAKSIQDIAKRDFENLRHEGVNGEPQPKVVRRGRPPNSKNQKKLLETSSPLNHGVGPGLSSVAAEDKANGSSSYNLRKAPPLNRFRSSGIFVSSYGSRNVTNYSEWLADWNDEFPANILRADMKYGKKQFTVDETRRDTYKQFNPLPTANNSSALSNPIGHMKRLVPVGLSEPLAYARSLARFAANLGPTAWKIASTNIESALPAGTPFGPGWVCENGPHSQPLSFSTEKQKSSTNSSAGDCNSNKLVMTPSTSDLNSGYAPAPDGLAEAVRKLNSPAEAAYMKTPFPSVQQKQPVFQSQVRNVFGGMFGYNTSTEGAPLVSQVMGPTSRNDHLSAMTNHFVRDEAKVRENWNILTPGYINTGQGYSHGGGETWGFGKSSWPAQQMRNSNIISGPPDLNVRIPAGSPSSSLQIGSPQQPDLALQL